MDEADGDTKAVQTSSSNDKPHAIEKAAVPGWQFSAMGMAMKNSKTAYKDYSNNQFWTYFSQDHYSQNDCR